jgi:DNA/RNA endonuclease YhcR with UshA esterase domain
LPDAPPPAPPAGASTGLKKARRLQKTQLHDSPNANNFTIFIDKKSLAKFKEAKIEDPAAHFRGKLVQVQGKVTLYRDRPEIKLSGPEAIRVVEKK